MTKTPERPRVKPHVGFAWLDAENVLVKGPALFVRYGGEAVPVLRALLPHLDGTRTPADLATQLSLLESDVRDVLEGLAADHVIEDAAHDENPRLPPAERARLAPQLQAWSHLTGAPGLAQNRVAAARIHVAGDGELATHIARLLLLAGAREASPNVAPEEADHLVLATDHPDPARFIGYNERALALRKPWTGAFLDDIAASVGPTVLPGQSACWRCYDLRAKGAHPNLERLLLYEAAAREKPAGVGLVTFAPLVAAWAAQAVLVSVAGAGAPPLVGQVLRVELLEMRASRHRVLRLPRCPACSHSDVPDVDRYAVEPPWRA